MEWNSGGVWGITVGSDGKLWFAETRGNKIGRIATTGEFSEFLLPTPNDGRVGPFGITVGSDGAVWFTERDKIGRIARTGEDSTEHIQGISLRAPHRVFRPNCDADEQTGRNPG